MLADKLQKFIFEHYPVKGSIVHLHSAWQELQGHARPPAEFGGLLAEAVCASVLLTSNIKFKGSVSLQIQSEGRLGLVLGQCTQDHRVRGIVRLKESGEGPALKNPVLSINLEPADGGQSYQGIVAFPDGSLSAALEEYFSRSEQLPTHVWLTVGDQCCSGMMLQRLPGRAMDEDNWNRITALASTVTGEELLSLEASTLLQRLFREDTIRLFKPGPVRFGCQCSKDKVGEMLQSLGETEIQQIISEQGEVEVRCEYCGQQYRFDRVDAAQLFVSAESFHQSAGRSQ